MNPELVPPHVAPDPIIDLLTTYNELNLPTPDELSEVPSALEYMRYVARNRPFVVRGGAADWRATQTWNIETLKELLQGQTVNVAVTPEGNADSPTRAKDREELLFIKPWEEQQPFDEFVDFVAQQESSDGTPNVHEVRYAQTQNDNLRNEYSPLFSHVEKDIPWARIALQQNPDAINLWIGNSLSTTALHKDNYENIYVQIIGQKHFVLLPPLAYACVNEKELSPASYFRTEHGLEMRREEGEKVPFATWDPDSKENGTQYSKFVKPVRFTLKEGDMLYLPALWYHKVSQSCSEEGICCAVNYWYDMDFGGSFYPLWPWYLATHNTSNHFISSDTAPTSDLLHPPTNSSYLPTHKPSFRRHRPLLTRSKKDQRHEPLQTHKRGIGKERNEEPRLRMSSHAITKLFVKNEKIKFPSDISPITTSK